MMAHTPRMEPTLAHVLWPASGGFAAWPRTVVLMLAGTLVLAISAKVQVPFWPVPITMQSLAVLVIGMSFGFRLGVATLALYLVEGAVGLPVFASGAGLAYLAGPTSGYLFGFVAAAAAAGWLAERGWDRNIWLSMVAMTLGTLILMGCGVAWLATLIGFEQALASGFTPFIAGGVLKIVLGALMLPSVWKLVERR
ncbi:biotin transporter BioY [Fodinicurvata fenggangensis]|uniref:biotin transporter BioY n=1 Tax=Fodinicurvata fenggangensis TaxID=1121830 RepID=UPI001FDEA49A|nr:biotin transporter BioY [Fodinicurvata fenggangensis]